MSLLDLIERAETWPRAFLGEIFDIGSSKRVLQKEWTRSGVPFYRAREIVKLAKTGSVENELFISEQHFKELEGSHGVPNAGDLMVSAVGTLGACYVVQPHDRFYFKDASVLQFRAKQAIEPKFFQYLFLNGDFLSEVKKGEGATVGTLTISRAKGISISLPPLEEQKRIVAVLDQAFAALDRARALAEANLADAEELFERQLARKFDDAANPKERVPFDQLCTALTPKTKIQRKEYLEAGAFPIVSQEADLVSGYWNDQSALMGLTKPVLVFGDHTRCLKYIDFDFVVGADGTKVLLPKPEIDPLYLYYGLRSVPLAEKGYARHFKFLKNVSLPKLELVVQEQMSLGLRSLEAEVSNLSGTYAEKLGELSDLRQSLLQRAFAGELT